MDACMFVIARNVYRHRYPLIIIWAVLTLFSTPPALYLVLRKTVGGLNIESISSIFIDFHRFPSIFIDFPCKIM